jgi:N-carbamoyl-L-amino-acid hydrolase
MEWTGNLNIEKLAPLAEKLFAEIRKLSRDGIGVTRDAYGSGESAAADYLRGFALDEGLCVRTDSAANLQFALPATASGTPAIWIGSHLDSVPQGGNFDGLAGIVAGLLCLIAQQQSAQHGSLPLKVVAFRGEESAWFGKAYLGSSAMLGKLSAQDLSRPHRTSGEPLATCMHLAGADVDTLRSGRPLFDKAQMRAYLELHIEQGPVMTARGLPLCVVSGIRGNFRHNRVVCVGEAGHSGAIPRWLRHDAVFAVSDLIARLDVRWSALLEMGRDLVVTVGVISTDAAEHSISRIPGSVTFSFELRSNDRDTLNDFYQVFREECQAVSAARGVRFEFDDLIEAAPATMSREVSEALTRACAQRAVPFDLIPSGAGHDAAVFANAGIPCGMLFIRNEHGSHNPREAMEMNDFMLGVRALADAASDLAKA